LHGLVLGSTDAAIHKRIAQVIAVIERETDLEMVRSRVESREEMTDSPTGDLATA
jgi:hypothetical protein